MRSEFSRIFDMVIMHATAIAAAGQQAGMPSIAHHRARKYVAEAAARQARCTVAVPTRWLSRAAGR